MTSKQNYRTMNGAGETVFEAPCSLWSLMKSLMDYQDQGRQQQRRVITRIQYLPSGPSGQFACHQNLQLIICGRQVTIDSNNLSKFARAADIVIDNAVMTHPPLTFVHFLLKTCKDKEKEYENIYYLFYL